MAPMNHVINVASYRRASERVVAKEVTLLTTSRVNNEGYKCYKISHFALNQSPVLFTIQTWVCI